MPPTNPPRPPRRRRPRNKMRLAPPIVAVVLLAIAGAAWAQDDAQIKGRQIAEELDRRDLGFSDSSVDLKMVLSNRQGQTSERVLRIDTLEVPDPNDGDRSLVVFDEPRDIKGTSFLSFTHILDPDDQWLYLPALKRVKRISSANKSGPFVGSEFAYEDLLSQEVEKYEYRWLRDEPCAEFECFVVERFPLYKDSGYTRQIIWVDQAEYRLMQIEFFDRKGDHMKTLVFSEHRQYLDQYWRAHRLNMVNHLTGKATVLAFSDYRFQTGLSERDFNKKRLERAR